MNAFLFQGCHRAPPHAACSRPALVSSPRQPHRSWMEPNNQPPGAVSAAPPLPAPTQDRAGFPLPTRRALPAVPGRCGSVLPEVTCRSRPRQMPRCREAGLMYAPDLSESPPSAASASTSPRAGGGGGTGAAPEMSGSLGHLLAPLADQAFLQTHHFYGLLIALMVKWGAQSVPHLSATCCLLENQPHRSQISPWPQKFAKASQKQK